MNIEGSAVRKLVEESALLERQKTIAYILSCTEGFLSQAKRDALANVASLIAQGEHTKAFHRGALDDQLPRVNGLMRRGRS